MSVSLHTQTGLHCLIIQVLNTRVCFINIWYTLLTSVHYNLEHGLGIVTESLSPLNLDYTISFFKVQARSHVTSHAMPDTVYLPCTLNWSKLVWTGYNLNLMYSSPKCGVNLSSLVFVTHRGSYIKTIISMSIFQIWPCFYHTVTGASFMTVRTRQLISQSFVFATF